MTAASSTIAASPGRIAEPSDSKSPPSAWNTQDPVIALSETWARLNSDRPNGTSRLTSLNVKHTQECHQASHGWAKDESGAQHQREIKTQIDPSS